MKRNDRGFINSMLMLLFGLLLTLPAVAAAAQDGDYRRRDDQRQDRRQDRREDRRERRQERREARRGRDWNGGNYGGSFQLRQTALNAGYNEGIKVGRKDSNRRGGSDYRNNSAYRKADEDYSSKLGDKELYRRYYRAGYENGYNDGSNGY
ncbi:MAG: hypothetical protein M3R15_35325 [Acidobacteriota bacterium]|nr:hypothetical protein [Acidobacteriota bacterium]